MQTLLRLKYIGTNYHGFQVQSNALSVCEVLQNAMQRVYSTRPDVKGCSRTDSGVHALDYCVSFRQPRYIDERRLPLALNNYLPQDIKVTGAFVVEDDFHARYSCTSKEYIYIVHTSPVDDPFLAGLVWRYPLELDIATMQAAAKYCVGEHDFRAFMTKSAKVDSTVRTVYAFDIRVEADRIIFHIKADGYLYNMVRIIVGTMIKVGTHQMMAESLPAVIAGADRAQAGETAPAKGLYLYKVNYGDKGL